MALRGLDALCALEDERHGRWRKLVRNGDFRRSFNDLCDHYAQWVTGPPLEVTVYEDDEYVGGELDRNEAFLGTYRIVDHGEEDFLKAWAAFRESFDVDFPPEVVEQIRLGKFPRLGACPASEWDALGQESDILPLPIIRLGEGLQDIPDGATAFIVGPYQQGLVVEALKGHIPKQKTRSRRDKLDIQLRLHDSAVRNGQREAVGSLGSSGKSRLQAAQKAIGNPSTEVPEAPDEEKKDIRDALAQLPLEERNAIRAVYLQGIKLENYAAKTQQSEAQVSALVTSGLSKLRPLMEAKGYEARPDADDTEDYAYTHNVATLNPAMAPGCHRTPRRYPDRHHDPE